MPTKLGVNCIGRTSNLVSTLIKAQPRATLIMDDLGLAHELTHALPNSIIIYRDWSLGDGRHLTMGPDTFIDICNRQYNGAKNLWFYTTNEQGFSPNNMDWHLRVLRESPSHLRFVGVNPAVGTYPDSASGWEYAEHFLRTISTQRDRFILGLHEYAAAVPVSGMPNFNNRIQNWNGLTLPAYHCGRFRYLEQFCASKGFPSPRIIMTEHGFDDLMDPGTKSWTSTLRVAAGYENIRGWKSLKDQWLDWYGGSKGWSPERALFEGLKWMDQNLYAKSAVEAQLIYCWGSNGDPSWDQFDISNAKEFHDAWIAYSSGSSTPLPTVPLPGPAPSFPPQPIVTGDSYAVDVPQQYVNLRDTPAIPSNIIGRINEGEVVVALEQKRVGNEYWTQVESGIGLVGWISLQWSPSAQTYGVHLRPHGSPTTFLPAISTASVGVNVRKNPTINSPRLGLISIGSAFRTTGEIVKTASEGDWLKVRLADGQIGWSSLRYLRWKQAV